MDIAYLLFLQGLRETAPVWVNSFFVFMSEFVNGLFRTLYPALIFWCLSKQAGYFLHFGLWGARWFNGLLKNTACVYRPWIKDPRVVCAVPSTATGYSFPSGHTTTAIILYGGTGVLLSKWKKWLGGLCFLLVLIAAFSRNWLCAHTPQDVVVALFTGGVFLFLAPLLLKWVDSHPEKDLPVAVVGAVLCIVTLLIITLKPYPLDYTAEGTLLVDPQAMMNDCFSSVGAAVGLLFGWVLERRFIRFSTEVSWWQRLARAAVGTGGILLFQKLLEHPLRSLLGGHWGRFSYTLLLTFFIIALYPLVFTRLEQVLFRKAEAKEN